MRSAARQGIDKLIIIGDVPPKLYDNMISIPMTMDEISARVRKIIPGFPGLDKPYRLCDLKPMFCYIFEDIISEYDCFMLTDLDAMYGDYRIIEEVIHKNNGEIDAITNNVNMFGGFFQWLNMKYIREKKGEWFRRFNDDEYTKKLFNYNNHHNSLDEHRWTSDFDKIGGRRDYDVRIGYHDNWESILYYNGKTLFSINKVIEVYTNHFFFIYKWQPVESLPLSTFESNSILINRKRWERDDKLPLIENLY